MYCYLLVQCSAEATQLVTVFILPTSRSARRFLGNFLRGSNPLFLRIGTAQ